MKSSSPHWSKTPKESVEQECERRGLASVVKGCSDLLTGKPVDDELILALGGPPAEWVRTGEPSGPDYWLRVWGARGLLYAWDESARPAVLQALSDEAWRVRDMALGRHRARSSDSGTTRPPACGHQRLAPTTQSATDGFNPCG
jgi:hypothetical protein